MKTDVNGCSTAAAGTEQYETFQTRKGTAVQYDYRTPQGVLFSCCAPTLEAARAKRDTWLVPVAKATDTAEAATAAPLSGRAFTTKSSPASPLRNNQQPAGDTHPAQGGSHA